MTKFDQLVQETIDEYKRGECTELTDEDFDQFLTPKDIEETNKEVERILKEYEINKKQKVS